MLTSNQETGVELDADIEQMRQRIASTVERWTPNQQVQDTLVPGLQLFRSDNPTSCTATVYEPSVCFMVQGTKSVSFGDRELFYQALTYMVSSVHLPVLGRILDASPESPYLAFKLTFDPQEVSNLVLEMGAQLPPVNDCCAEGNCALSMATIERPLLDALCRFTGLLDVPQDIPVLAPLIRREILYRVLLGEMGPRMRKFAVADSSVQRVSKVIAVLKDRYTESLKVRELADEVNMSESALFHTFKQVTRMSPLQYQKKLRLHEARRLMLSEGLEAATASYRVGYESPSHFSREYSRLFGAPPRADVIKLRGEQAVTALS
ncbi:AraC family transcriptional regulator [Marinobacter sp. CA1]|uniref:AraC family transcriptional regulator n=1 Tax=Marinobacter sp. CA1 TaxID=2817656 RepID=UPI001D0940EB|nr:AraC family transcriptional regulator [Marinobacter sp. CA1]MCG8519435.1 AraC family transcriptional regulator [Pseudomonadales bacterium]UDL05103.1 AraC family transcriptional regulator [Marinobacter sp. CA1]